MNLIEFEKNKFSELSRKYKLSSYKGASSLAILELILKEVKIEANNQFINKNELRLIIEYQLRVLYKLKDNRISKISIKHPLDMINDSKVSEFESNIKLLKELKRFVD